MKLLEALLREPGVLVTRDQIRERLWPADTFVEFDRSLNGVVGKLRQALNDSAERPVYIETTARKGYRFIAPVTTGVATPQEARNGVVAVPQRPRWQWWAGGGMLTACFALFIAFAPNVRTKPQEPMLRLDLDVGEDFSQPAISPDGLTLAFVTKGGLAVRRLGQPRILRMAGTEGASFPFFSPNGQWVGYFVDRKLRKMTLGGDGSVTLCDAPQPGGGSWGEDDRIVAALGLSGGLSVISANGGTAERFTHLTKDLPLITNHRAPQVLPQGRGVLFVATAGVGAGSLRVQPPGSGPSKLLVENSAGGRYLSSGFLVYTQNATLFAAPFDLDRLELTGKAGRLAEGLIAFDFRTGVNFDVSRSGTLVFQRSSARPTRTAVWLDAAGREEPLMARVANYACPRLSPDGKRLAFAASFAGQLNIGVYDLVTHKETRMTVDTKAQCCPVWSPDGAYLAFANAGQVALIPSDGSGPMQLLLPPGRQSVPWTFSPDGQWLAFHRNEPQTGPDLWIAPLRQDGSKMTYGPPKPLLQRPGLQAAPAISPDGRWVAYGSDETGRVELFVMPFFPDGPAPSNRWQVSQEGAMSPVWSRHSAQLFYRGPDRRVMSVAYTTKDGVFLAQEPRVWSSRRLGDVGPMSSFDVTADGQRIAALVDADDARADETHLRLLLHVDQELRRGVGGRK